MSFEELTDFIENKMRMSHVYQRAPMPKCFIGGVVLSYTKI